MAFADIITSALRTASAVQAVALVYRRPGVGEVEIATARWGGTRTETASEDGGTVIRGQSRDCLIEAELLVIGDESIEPAIGDEIIETTSAGKRMIYEVRPLGGDRHWRWSDAGHSWYRVHVVQKATE